MVHSACDRKAVDQQNHSLKSYEHDEHSRVTPYSVALEQACSKQLRINTISHFSYLLKLNITLGHVVGYDCFTRINT